MLIEHKFVFNFLPAEKRVIVCTYFIGRYCRRFALETQSIVVVIILRLKIVFHIVVILLNAIHAIHTRLPVHGVCSFAVVFHTFVRYLFGTSSVVVVHIVKIVSFHVVSNRRC